jgi:hypothetical protein
VSWCVWARAPGLNVNCESAVLRVHAGKFRFPDVIRCVCACVCAELLASALVYVCDLARVQYMICVFACFSLPACPCARPSFEFHRHERKRGTISLPSARRSACQYTYTIFLSLFFSNPVFFNKAFGLGTRGYLFMYPFACSASVRSAACCMPRGSLHVLWCRGSQRDLVPARNSRLFGPGMHLADVGSMRFLFAVPHTSNDLVEQNTSVRAKLMRSVDVAEIGLPNFSCESDFSIMPKVMHCNVMA